MRQVIAALLLAICFSSNLNAASIDHQQLLNRIIELDGLGSSLDSVPGQLKSVAAQRQLTSKHPEEDQKFYEAILESMDVPLAKNTFIKELSKNVDDETLQIVLNWLETPLGRKISAAESSVAKSENTSDMLRYLAELQTTPPSKERVEVIRRFVDETNLAKDAARTYGKLLKMILSGAAQGLDSKDSEGIAEELEKVSDKLADSVRQQFIMASFYTYQNISNQEMEQYTDILLSDDYLRYHEAVGNAMDAALTVMFSKVGNKLGETLKASKNEVCK